MRRSGTHLVSTLKRIVLYDLKNLFVPTTLLFRAMVIYTRVIQNDSELQGQRYVQTKPNVVRLDYVDSSSGQTKENTTESAFLTTFL